MIKPFGGCRDAFKDFWKQVDQTHFRSSDGRFKLIASDPSLGPNTYYALEDKLFPTVLVNNRTEAFNTCMRRML